MMLFEQLIPENREEFKTEIEAMCERLLIKPDWAMLTFYIETAAAVTGVIDHKIQNSKSKATGYIQFMPDTAKSLGTTVDELKKMTNIEQLKYVEKYLKPYTGKMESPVDVYLAVFFPAAIGKDDNYILQTAKLSAETVACWNPLYDLNKDKKIQKKEVKQKVLSFVPKGYQL